VRGPRTGEGRCRRCGAGVEEAPAALAHHLFVRVDGEVREVVLRMCHPCGAGFPTVRDRDEYARLTYFG